MYKRICRSLFTLLLCMLFTFSAPAAAAAQTAQPCTAPSSVSSSLRRTLPVPGVYAKSGRLIKKGNKIRYKRSNGKYIRSSWKTIHGKTYYFMKNTFAVKGFQKIGGKVYYFNRFGVLQKKRNNKDQDYMARFFLRACPAAAMKLRILCDKKENRPGTVTDGMKVRISFRAGLLFYSSSRNTRYFSREIRAQDSRASLEYRTRRGVRKISG